jgi:hypothetical protein
VIKRVNGVANSCSHLLVFSFYIYSFGACGALRRRTLPGSAIRLGATHQPLERLPFRLLGRVMFWRVQISTLIRLNLDYFDFRDAKHQICQSH